MIYIERINSGLGFIAGICIAAGSLLIVTEISSRLFLGKSLLITDEYTGYLMAVSSFLGLGYVEKNHGHIRMDLIDLLGKRFPRLIVACRFFAYIVALIFSAYLVYVGWKLFYQSYIFNSKSMQISETPLAIPQIFVPIGALALLLQYASNLAKYCMQLGSK